MLNPTAQLFVHFAPNIQIPKGLQAGFPYPVFAIDINEEEDTRFLLSNRAGEFIWVSSKLVRRSTKKDAVDFKSRHAQPSRQELVLA